MSLIFDSTPPHLTVDSKGRNWLELLVERRKVDDRDSRKVHSFAANLVHEGDQHPVMSDKWLECHWRGYLYG